jgi:hypothetical protein
MAIAYLIPLQSTNQQIQVTLAGTLYTLTTRWNEMNQAWNLDIGDADGNPLITGIAVVTGVDLLTPYEYLGIGGQIVAQTTGNTDAVPTFDNLGSLGNLYFVVS